MAIRAVFQAATWQPLKPVKCRRQILSLRAQSAEAVHQRDEQAQGKMFQLIAKMQKRARAKQLPQSLSRPTLSDLKPCTVSQEISNISHQLQAGAQAVNSLGSGSHSGSKSFGDFSGQREVCRYGRGDLRRCRPQLSVSVGEEKNKHVPSSTQSCVWE